MSPEKKEDCLPVVPSRYHGIPLDELAEQARDATDGAPRARSGLLHGLLSERTAQLICGSAYSGCTDLCGCDGTMCAAECGSLCAVDSCLVDIV